MEEALIESKIEETVISILESSDMDTMTMNEVRKMAGEELGVDLSDHKEFIRNIVESFVTEEKEENEESEEKQDESDGKEYDDDGNLIICSLSNKRRVTIQEFQGKTLVSIREYYEKDGKMRPTTKGISLTAEQWEVFSKSVPAIEESIKKMGSRRG